MEEMKSWHNLLNTVSDSFERIYFLSIENEKYCFFLFCQPTFQFFLFLIREMLDSSHQDVFTFLSSNKVFLDIESEMRDNSSSISLFFFF